MPEGDTIFRAARHLRAAVVGRPVVRFEAAILGARGRALVGQTPTAVTSRGKNLLFTFSNDLVLYTHMKMTGSWHVYRHGEPWRKSPRAARVRLDNADFVAVCFSAPVIELMTAARARRHPALAQLGPDLLAEPPDYPEMTRRLRALGATPLGEALLNQRALAGVGNVYKSELCFLRRLDPFAPLSSVSDPELQSLLREARRLMRENLDTFRRTTRHGLDRQRHWVYGRSGASCHRCGEKVRMRRQGDAGRSTYFCPRCQRVGARPSDRTRPAPDARPGASSEGDRSS